MAKVRISEMKGTVEEFQSASDVGGRANGDTWRGKVVDDCICAEAADVRVRERLKSSIK